MTASKFGISIAMAVLLAGAAVGHAQQAQQGRKTAQSDSAAAATSSTAPAASKPAADAKSSADTQADSGLPIALLKEARDDGFKPVKRGETTLYCKSEIIVGSSFPVHTCVDSDHLKLMLEQYRAQRMQLEQMHSGGLQGH